MQQPISSRKQGSSQITNSMPIQDMNSMLHNNVHSILRIDEANKKNYMVKF